MQRWSLISPLNNHPLRESFFSYSLLLSIYNRPSWAMFLWTKSTHPEGQKAQLRHHRPMLLDQAQRPVSIPLVLPQNSSAH